MNLEPQKFFIGLMDFFSILLPGALLTYLLMGDVGPHVLGFAKYQKLTGAEAWAAFLVSSYLSGHLLFLMGSWLDVFPYDWLKRRYSLKQQIIRLARRGALLPWFARALIWTVFKQEQESDLALDCVKKIKAQALKGLGAQDAVNIFQWAKTFLAKEHPESLVTVQRFEADSKFFRSFVIVLFVLVVIWSLQRQWSMALFGAMLVLPALWRYIDQRFKATNQACWSVIALTARDGKLSIDEAAHEDGSLTHAGGVVFRMRGAREEYLLVEAKHCPEQWVLPKGHIKEDEQPRDTAVREVHEETGVWARIEAELGRVSYSINGTVTTVQFFLMEYAGRGMKSHDDVNRQHLWLPIDEAIRQAKYRETKDVLEAARRLAVRISGAPSTE